MTKIKICGISKADDIETVNLLKPEYIGFVFAEKSKRRISAGTAYDLKKMLHPAVKAVGVFVDEPIDAVAKLMNNNAIDLAQLHGQEDEAYIKTLRYYTDKPVIKAFAIKSENDIAAANKSSADFVLLDSSGGGTGTVFNWDFINLISRPYFLAGGLTPQNAGKAVERLEPYALDVSSGVETNGYKDKNKIAEFISAVRKEDLT